MATHNKPLTMFVSAVVAIVFALVSLISASRQHDNLDERVFSFALWGDTPYSDVEKTTKIPALIQDINNSGSVFSVFDGDIKSGSSRCDDVVYAEAVARFNTFERPMIYVPGDNEWTDCHRTNNGGFNALERLTFLRLTLFASPQSFGQKTLLLEHQDQYPENTRWTFGDVVFVGLNVPGSNNNKVHPGQCVSNKSARTLADCDADNIEYAARDAANIRFLNESFDMAMSLHARGLMVVIQGDPSFDLPETETDNERTCVRASSGECLDPPNDTNLNLANYDGYDAFLASVRNRTVDFGRVGGQVVLVHGDTHFFKVDKPFDSPTSVLPNFTRLCTFGSPGVHWVKVNVDPRSRNLFTFEPMIVPQ